MNYSMFYRYRMLPLCYVVMIAFASMAPAATTASNVNTSDANLNYIVEATPTSNCANVTIATDIFTGNGVSFVGSGTTDGQGVVTYHYLNGKGLLAQEAVIDATGTANLTSQITYDAFGRITHKWLPVVNTEIGGYLADYDSRATVLSSYPYEETIWEQSPLDRLQQEKGMDVFHDHPSNVSHLTNSGNEVKQFAVGNNQLLCTGFYTSGMLSKTISADPDNKPICEFKDALGRLIMRRVGANACTYYVYNDMNQLAFVIPPILADRLSVGSAYSVASENMTRYAYMYQYDKRGNICQKRLPACDPVYYVYDRAGRLALCQDGNQRERGAYWTAYVYDHLGRLVITMEVELQNVDFTNLQADFETRLSCADFNSAGTTESLGNTGYLLNNIPGTLSRLLTVTYYDNYNFLNLESAPCRSALSRTYRPGYDLGNPAPNAAKGLLTGQRVYNLTNDTYNTTSYYYDSRDRLVQQHASNAMGGYDRILYHVSFSGKPLKQMIIHSTSAISELTEEYSFSYDNLDRLVDTYYKFGDDEAYLLSRQAYDYMGRLSSKSLINGLDTVRYSYDICSHLTQIHAASGFEENLYYATTIFPNHYAAYNGNISGVLWTYGDKTNGYLYRYDSMNRLYSAEGVDDGNFYDYHYSESYLYDKHGNILNLTRWNNEDIMSYLSYSYNGNQVVNISDSRLVSVSYRDKLYQDAANSQSEFQYDKNGNLIADFDRKICVIQYNLLNLPQVLQFTNGDQIIHEYDALGHRLSSTYYVRKQALVEPATDILPASENPQDYFVLSHAIVGNKRYVRNSGDWQLDYVFNPEGYTRWFNSWEHYTFYYVKDHLGNVRETFVNSEPGRIILTQRMQYYPSGLPWGESYSAAEQPFKYSGKEFIEISGLDEYDSEARWYYPAIMRTTTMDPLCEKYYSTSPYAWCGNNPVNYIDPDGRYTEVLANGDGTYTTKNGTADDDLNIYVVDKEGNRTGEIIGQMFTAYSFTYDDGKFVEGATINMNDRTGQEFVDHVTIDYPDPVIYAVGALPNMPNDIKTQGKDADPYRAMPINLFDGNGTKIATARDVGNFGAGFVAGTTGISWKKTRNMFDRLQGWLIKKEREAPVSQEAQKIGYLLGYERLGKYMVNNKR